MVKYEQASIQLPNTEDLDLGLVRKSFFLYRDQYTETKAAKKD